MSNVSKINIIQHGIDGVGHQLHGIISCLALHNIGNYYFDGFVFMNKSFIFGHISKKVALQVKKYFKEIAKKFIESEGQIKKKYTHLVYAHEVYNIPNNYDSNAIYLLDNSYYFNKIPINELEYDKYLLNICKQKDLFINSQLPAKRLCDKNVVIHLRQGDALVTPRGVMINKYNKDLNDLFPILINKYHDHTFYIHTDGDASFLTNILSNKNTKFVVFDKNESVLNVLSDFIYSKVFIAGHSSLSTACIFLGNQKLVIIPNDIKHSIPSTAIKIKNINASILNEK